MKIVPMSVELVDHMGSDLSVVNAARVSFAKESEWENEKEQIQGVFDSDLDGGCYDLLDPGFRGVLKQQDQKLINYLAKHNHWSPYAHAFASFRIKAPIFVARQLVKHQVGLAWNEVSRRYVDDEPEFWMPTEWRGRPVNAKQGSNEQTVEVDNNYLKHDLENILSWYTNMINNGVAPEQARMILPQNTMTEWIWSGSLAAFCRVCKLRLDPHAQEETRELVEGIKGLLEPLFPVSFTALTEFKND